MIRYFQLRALGTALAIQGFVLAALLFLFAARAGAATFTNGLATFDAAWEIIQKTHFDPKFNGVDWQAVRDELRPRAARAQSRATLDAIIQEMLDRLGQSHMEILPGSENAGGQADTGRKRRRAATDDAHDESGDVGLEVRWVGPDLVVTRVEPGSPAARKGIRPGWIVREIGPVDVADLRPESGLPEKAAAASVDGWAAAMHLLKGAPNSHLKMDFTDGANRNLTEDLTRARQAGEPAKFGNLPTFFADLKSEKIKGPGGRQFGLIRFNIWMIPVSGRFSEAMDQLRQCDGIIIDLRGNVGGMAALVMGIAGHFLNEPLALGTMKMRESELRFLANPRKVNTAGTRVEPFAGRVAILVDQVSLSASEIFAGGMQSLGRARIFGERTGGMALPAVFDRLPNGDLLIHAMGDFVTSTGVRLEGSGVIPDVEAKTSRQALLAGKDEPLAAAINWLSQPAAK